MNLNEYKTEPQLRRQQLRMLEMLKELHRICIKYDIKYWLSSGTLLGAARHKGFIPWDDDLDIEMERKDYIRLMKILPKELNVDYVVQTQKTDKNYMPVFPKIRDTKSDVTEHDKSGLKYTGIFVDIFIMEKGSLPLLKMAGFIHSNLCSMKYKKKRFPFTVSAFSGLFYKTVTNVLYPVFRIFKNNENKFYHTFGSGMGGFLLHRDIEDIYPLTTIEFEGLMFNAPKNTDGYLRKIYGDYMKLPDSIDETHISQVRFFD